MPQPPCGSPSPVTQILLRGQPIASERYRMYSVTQTTQEKNGTQRTIDPDYTTINKGRISCSIRSTEKLATVDPEPPTPRNEGKHLPKLFMRGTELSSHGPQDCHRPASPVSTTW